MRDTQWIHSNLYWRVSSSGLRWKQVASDPKEPIGIEVILHAGVVIFLYVFCVGLTLTKRLGIQNNGHTIFFFFGTPSLPGCHPSWIIWAWAGVCTDLDSCKQTQETCNSFSLLIYWSLSLCSFCTYLRFSGRGIFCAFRSFPPLPQPLR